MKEKEEIRINVRTTEQQKRELEKLSALTGISQSVIIREAVTEKVASLNQVIEKGGTVCVGIIGK